MRQIMIGDLVLDALKAPGLFANARPLLAQAHITREAGLMRSSPRLAIGSSSDRRSV
jgi:hypothetical protein